MPLMTIILEGGYVTAIYADNPNVDIVVMDKDIEGCDPDAPGVYGDIAYLRQPELLPYHQMNEDEAWFFQCCDVEAITRHLPWWMREIARCDGLEVHPVWDTQRDEDTDETWCEVCKPEQAHFWSVYGHLKEGGVTCLEDFPTEQEALAFAEQLLQACPHLQEYGLS